MLGLYRKNSKDKQLQYKIAYYKDNSNNREAFKYYLVDFKDIAKTEWIQGIEQQEITFVIRTTYGRDFNINDRILIDDMQYIVTFIHIEPSEQDNGLFRRSMRPYKYLTLKK